MTKHSLRALLKIRVTAVNKAKEELADALQAEKAASLAELAVANSIQAELGAAVNDAADDATVERLAEWLPCARLRHRAACERFTVAEAKTVRARAALAAAARAEAVVENLIQVAATEERAETKRHLQMALNEQMLLRGSDPRR